MIYLEIQQLYFNYIPNISDDWSEGSGYNVRETECRARSEYVHRQILSNFKIEWFIRGESAGRIKWGWVAKGAGKRNESMEGGKMWKENISTKK